jgi:hypothetical protein
MGCRGRGQFLKCTPGLRHRVKGVVAANASVIIIGKRSLPIRFIDKFV